MRTLRLAVAAALLMPVGGLAQVDLPSDRIADKDRRMFRDCRAAIFFHLDDKGAESRIPREVAESMLEQVNFIMFETIRTAPAQSVDESRRAMSFVEQFFLDFSRTIAELRPRLSRIEEREAVLLSCQPVIWRVVRERIDYLMLWREREIDAPAFTNRLEEQIQEGR